MVKRVWDRLPSGPLTYVSAIIGWGLMAIGLVTFFTDYLPPRYVPVNTAEFMADTSPYLVGLIIMTSGFFVAKPGYKHRKIKGQFGAFSCIIMVGTALWPMFSHSDNPVAIRGIIGWVMLALLLLLDANSPTYSKHYNEKHYH